MRLTMTGWFMVTSFDKDYVYIYIYDQQREVNIMMANRNYSNGKPPVRKPVWEIDSSDGGSMSRTV